MLIDFLFLDMDANTRLELVELLYANGKSPTAAMRAYKKQHGLRNNPFTLNTLMRLIKKFKEKKTLLNLSSTAVHLKLFQ